MLQRSLISYSRTSGVMRRLVSHREVRLVKPRGGWPEMARRYGYVWLSTLLSSWLPLLAARMCASACYARSVQVMRRLWLISWSAAIEGIWRFP